MSTDNKNGFDFTVTWDFEGDDRRLAAQVAEMIASGAPAGEIISVIHAHVVNQVAIADICEGGKRFTSGEVEMFDTSAIIGQVTALMSQPDSAGAVIAAVRHHLATEWVVYARTIDPTVDSVEAIEAEIERDAKVKAAIASEAANHDA